MRPNEFFLSDDCDDRSHCWSHWIWYREKISVRSVYEYHHCHRSDSKMIISLCGRNVEMLFMQIASILNIVEFTESWWSFSEWFVVVPSMTKFTIMYLLCRIKKLLCINHIRSIHNRIRHRVNRWRPLLCQHEYNIYIFFFFQNCWWKNILLKNFTP